MPHSSLEPQDLAELFQNLETTTTASGWQGITERRIQSRSTCDLFVGIKKPLNLRVIRAKFRASVISEPYSVPAFRGLEITERRDTDTDGIERLIVTLHAPSASYNDVFTSLAEDIARHVGGQEDEGAAAAAFLRRLQQWQRLLQKHVLEGLSPEEQRGLYGELRFLRDFVLPNRTVAGGMACWTGPSAAAKDFQFPINWAAEVKTTLAKQPQMLQISSERQLDDTGLTELYLVHIAVESQHGGGETLPEIVEQVKSIVAADGAAQALLEDKLMEVGYLNAHASQYHGAGYIWRGTSVYRVTDGFPRIVEQGLHPGIGNVRYSISAAACQPFLVDPAEFSERLAGV